MEYQEVNRHPHTRSINRATACPATLSHTFCALHKSTLRALNLGLPPCIVLARSSLSHWARLKKPGAETFGLRIGYGTNYASGLDPWDPVALPYNFPTQPRLAVMHGLPVPGWCYIHGITRILGLSVSRRLCYARRQDCQDHACARRLRRAELSFPYGGSPSSHTVSLVPYLPVVYVGTSRLRVGLILVSAMLRVKQESGKFG